MDCLVGYCGKLCDRIALCFPLWHPMTLPSSPPSSLSMIMAPMRLLKQPRCVSCPDSPPERQVKVSLDKLVPTNHKSVPDLLCHGVNFTEASLSGNHLRSACTLVTKLAAKKPSPMVCRCLKEDAILHLPSSSYFARDSRLYSQSRLVTIAVRD